MSKTIIIVDEKTSLELISEVIIRDASITIRVEDERNSYIVEVFNT